MSAFNSPKNLTIEKKNSEERRKEMLQDEAAIFFDGMCMFFAFVGAIEFGFLYTTIISMLLMIFAF